MIKNIPYWRLSSFYWFYFATLGAFIPYWGLYLSDAGYDPVQIGQLIAVIMGTKIVAPYIWGWIADHRGNRLTIIRIGAILSLLGFSSIFLVNGFWALFLVLMGFSFFWNAILPQYEALTFNHLGKKTDQYSWIRIWGSLGFVAAVTIMGWVLMSMPVNQLPVVVTMLLAGIAVSTFLVSEHNGNEHHETHTSIIQILKCPEVIALLTACLLVQASHGPYYTFYSIYAEEHGYEKSWIGVLWAIGVLSEVVAFALMPWLVKRFGFRNLLLASLFSGSLRWLMITFLIDNVLLTTFAQIFHASTFGIYHAVAIAYIHRFFKGNKQGKGQALYSSVSFGVGGAMGSLYGGYLWESQGSTLAFILAAVLSFVAFAISWKYTRN